MRVRSNFCSSSLWANTGQERWMTTGDNCAALVPFSKAIKKKKKVPKSPQWKSGAVLLCTALSICFLPDLFDTSHSLDSTETLLCVLCWRWPQITSRAGPSPARALKHHLQLYRRRLLTKRVPGAQASVGCLGIWLFHQFQDTKGVQVVQPSSQKQTEQKCRKFSSCSWLPQMHHFLSVNTISWRQLNFWSSLKSLTVESFQV